MTENELVFTDPRQVTPAWLTACLRAAGALPEGRVLDIIIRPNAAFNSLTSHLELSCSPGTPPGAPRALVLKINRARDGENEVGFYRSVPASARLPLAGCYHSAFSPETGDSHLLLRDLSASHQPPVTRQQLIALQGVPTARHLEGIIDCLAELHACWWDHPQIGSGTGMYGIRPWYSDHEHYLAHIQRRRREWTSFLGSAGGQLSTAEKAIYQDVLEALPRLWERRLSARLRPGGGITVTQGDCYLSQFLCPLAEGRTYLVDFDSVSANFAAYDLVYLLPTFWTRAQRQAHDRELRLLERYQRALAARGVSGFTLETLLDDYRLVLTLMIFDPIWDQTNGSSPSYWQPKLKCLTQAWLDLDCAALLS